MLAVEPEQVRDTAAAKEHNEHVRETSVLGRDRPSRTSAPGRANT